MITIIPFYKTIEETATKSRVLTRTIHRWIKKNKVHSVKMGDTYFIIDDTLRNQFMTGDPLKNVIMTNMTWVPLFCRQYKVAPLNVYEHIILGKVNAIGLANKVFVSPDDPTVIQFLADRKIRYKRKPKKYT